MGGRLCSVADCLNLARRGGVCNGHEKRAQREAVVAPPLRQYGLSAIDNLRHAANTFADGVSSEDDEAWKRADDLLRKVAIAYAVSLGYRKPKYRPPKVRTTAVR